MHFALLHHCLVASAKTPSSPPLKHTPSTLCKRCAHWRHEQCWGCWCTPRIVHGQGLCSGCKYGYDLKNQRCAKLDGEYCSRSYSNADAKWIKADDQCHSNKCLDGSCCSDAAGKHFLLAAKHTHSLSFSLSLSLSHTHSHTHTSIHCACLPVYVSPTGTSCDDQWIVFLIMCTMPSVCCTRAQQATSCAQNAAEALGHVIRAPKGTWWMTQPESVARSHHKRPGAHAKWTRSVSQVQSPACS